MKPTIDIYRDFILLIDDAVNGKDWIERTDTDKVEYIRGLLIVLNDYWRD